MEAEVKFLSEQLQRLMSHNSVFLGGMKGAQSARTRSTALCGVAKSICLRLAKAVGEDLRPWQNGQVTAHHVKQLLKAAERQPVA